MESTILEENAILLVVQKIDHIQRQDGLMGERLPEVLESAFGKIVLQSSFRKEETT